MRRVTRYTRKTHERRGFQDVTITDEGEELNGVRGDKLYMRK